MVAVPNIVAVSSTVAVPNIVAVLNRVAVPSMVAVSSVVAMPNMVAVPRLSSRAFEFGYLAGIWLARGHLAVLRAFCYLTSSREFA